MPLALTDRESDRLQFRENVTDENTCDDPKQEPVVVIGNPNAGSPELFVRFEIAFLADFLELHIQLDCWIVASLHRQLFAADNRQGGKVGVGGRVDDDPINVPLPQRLAPEIEQG